MALCSVLSPSPRPVPFPPRVLDDDQTYLKKAADVSPIHPVVITKFIEGAKELDIDAVADRGRVLVSAVSEHVEDAGVHSGARTVAMVGCPCPFPCLTRSGLWNM